MLVGGPSAIFAATGTSGPQRPKAGQMSLASPTGGRSPCSNRLSVREKPVAQGAAGKGPTVLRPYWPIRLTRRVPPPEAAGESPSIGAGVAGLAEWAVPGSCCRC